MWWKERCLGCKACKNACLKRAITFRNDNIQIDNSKCDLCGACVGVCYPQALELVGKEMTVAEVMKEIEKDTVFYEESGGGVTFSGGEPLMQPNFLFSLLKACKENGIHTALDTCGLVKTEELLKISEYVDLFLYDLKVIDESKHIKFTGVSNKLIRENLRELSAIGKNVIVRFPLIPSVNDYETDISRLGEFVSTLNNIHEIDVLPYHKAGVEKAKRLKNSTVPRFIYNPPSEEKLSGVKETLHSFRIKLKIGG